jgi:hypothetical protein
MQLYSPPYVQHGPPISVFLIWSPDYHRYLSLHFKVINF